MYSPQPDPLGIVIGAPDTFVSGGYPSGPTASNLAAAGITVRGAQTQTPSSFWTDPLNYDFGPSLDKVFGEIPVIGAVNNALGSTGNPKSVLSGGLSATGSALSFITDIPRVATTLLGLILIIAGIFALTKGPVVNIVSSAVREAATS